MKAFGDSIYRLKTAYNLSADRFWDMSIRKQEPGYTKP